MKKISPLILSLITCFPKFIAATFLAAIFFTFILQVFSRYVLQSPFGWTLELCLTLWVWVVLFCNAFYVREKDHVVFDVVYLSASARLRQILALISSAAIVIAMIWSFLPTWDYVNFLKIRRSATLKIPMNQVMMIYIIFMIAVIIRYSIRFFIVLRHGAPGEDHSSTKPNTSQDRNHGQGNN